MKTLTQKRVFNPRVEADRQIAEKYVRSALRGNATWGKNGCPFTTSGRNSTVDGEIRTKLLAYYTNTRIAA